MNFGSSARAGFAVALAITLTACQTTNTSVRTASAPRSNFCEERPEICVLVGGLVFGGVVALAASSGGGGAPAAGGGVAGPAALSPAVVMPPPVVVPPVVVGVLSDRRLKHDIVPVETLPNGLMTYGFKYDGDDRWFVGVMAQDLLADDRFRDAVMTMPNGYYAVDYASLGLAVTNMDIMQAAGREALQRAL